MKKKIKSLHRYTIFYYHGIIRTLQIDERRSFQLFGIYTMCRNNWKSDRFNFLMMAVLTDVNKSYRY